MLGYETERHRVDVGDYALDLLVLRPHEQHGPVPGVLWIHGGGYMLGMAGMAHASRMAPLVRSGEAVVVSPRYRLAWRKPYPAAVLDCYAALLWLQEHAQELGCAPDQLFVGGESAGGGLAAAACLLARDMGEVAVAFQMPLYPMLDCRDTRTSADNHGRVWNTARNHWGWRGYLGPLWGSAAVPAYASPALEDDLSGMPPAYTFVSDGEPFLAETLDYVRALQAAGVSAACDVYHGDVHAFDMLTPWTAEARAAIAHFEERFRQAAATCRAAQPRR
ncbi:MAG: alpha/beta hydrolase [Olsenella sp.]|nr:alpha/beta hydrolase [Olsenella sp.]